MKKSILAFFCTLLFLGTGLSAQSPEPTTFVLTNEGGLIDDLISAGYGEGSLYEALLALQPASGGVISSTFLNTLSACPAGSEIFTAKLSYFAGLNNPVCVNSDGTFAIQPIFARDFFQETGYQTYPNPYTLSDGQELFTRATAPEYYLDAGAAPGGGRYQAFAIAWSLDKTPTTIVLSNESPGYLIDNLIEAGHGGKSLYEVLQLLQPDSGGAIPQAFLDTLAACPAGSEVFTATLTQIQHPANNPICINSDGTLVVLPIYGQDYSGETGYQDNPGSPIGGCATIFTMATNSDFYIDSGSSNIPGNPSYQTFTIIWGQAAEEDLYRVTARVDGGHGTVSPTSARLNPGQSLTLTLSPNAGYSVASIRDNGREMSPDTRYIIEDIREDHQVVVAFANETPAVRIEQPLDGATVSGSVQVVAQATDDLGVEEMTLSVDGSVIGRKRLTKSKSRGEATLFTAEDGRSVTFSWDCTGYTMGDHTLTVTATDAAGASSSDSVTVSLQNLQLSLSAERKTVRAWSIRRDYADIALSVQNPESRIAAYRLLRRTGSGAFIPIATFNPGQLTTGVLTHQDKYLEKNQAYTYRLEALDASGQLLAQSNEVTL